MKIIDVFCGGFLFVIMSKFIQKTAYNPVVILGVPPSGCLAVFDTREKALDFMQKTFGPEDLRVYSQRINEIVQLMHCADLKNISFNPESEQAEKRVYSLEEFLRSVEGPPVRSIVR